MSENERGHGRQREWKLKKALDAFGNIFGINICFVIFSLPIITIGASTAAAYAMSIRLQEDEEETVLRGFIHEFKRSFKQATIAFLGFVVAAAVLVAEWILVNTQKGAISVFYTIVFYLELLFVALIYAYLYPLIARYHTTVKQAVKNAVLLSVGYFWSWVKIIVAWVAPIALSIIYPIIFLHTWYLWLLILFGAIIYGTSYTIRNVFKQNEEALKQTEEEAAEEEKKQLEKERQLEEGRAALAEGQRKLAEREEGESHAGGHGMSAAEREHESAKDPEDQSIREEQKEEKVSQKPSKPGQKKQDSKAENQKQESRNQETQRQDNLRRQNQKRQNEKSAQNQTKQNQGKQSQGKQSQGKKNQAKKASPKNDGPRV